MNKTETGNTNGSEPIPQPFDGVAQCGTPTTPPCPRYELLRVRTETIHQVAGPCPSRRRLEEAAEQVDRYLIQALRGAEALTKFAQEHDATHDQHAPAPR